MITDLYLVVIQQSGIYLIVGEEMSFQTSNLGGCVEGAPPDTGDNQKAV
jgi:hypothetical protein